MKRILLALIVAATLAVAIGILSYYNGPGYVVFSFMDTSIETSFVFALGAIATAFFIFYYLIRSLSSLLKIPDYLGLRYHKRQAEKARNSLIKGLIEISEGRFAQAEKILLKQVEHSDTALLNYLIAARAAQQQGAYERRDEYLRLAHESTPSADIAIGITQAELQLAHQQYEQALATLSHLRELSPRHAYVKKLLARTYQQLGDWDQLHELLADVRKSSLMPDVQMQQLEVDTYTGLLSQSIQQQDTEKAQRIWKEIPRNLKDNVDVLNLYVDYLISKQQDDEAAELIQQHLNQQWHESLLHKYASLHVSQPQKQLETAEAWLQQHSRNPVLLLALGKLCIKSELWGKAKNYLETSLSIKPMAETYLSLAVLLEDKMHEAEEAQSLYRQGLKLLAEPVAEKTEQLPISSNITKHNTELAPVLKIIQ